MNMNYRQMLADRISQDVIRLICAETSGSEVDAIDRKEELYSLITDPDDRIAYNALWVFTHFSHHELLWLAGRRDELIDLLLHSRHIGRTRLLLSVIQRISELMPDPDETSSRTDYLDFCLSNINSNLPYGIRALCMKQAFAICRHYPELMREFMLHLEMLESFGNMSPGLATARRNILKQLPDRRRNS